MNKLITKIMATVAGFAMAIGVGVGVVNHNANPIYADPEEAFSFSRSGSSDSVTSGYSMVLTNYKGNADNYQDKNSTVGLDIGVKKSSGTIWSQTPQSISLTVKVGGGTAKNPLANNVVANLIDSSGNAIANTDTVVTTKVETTTGKNYTVSIPTVNNAAGIMIHHAKESGYNIRIYSFSLSYEAAGGDIPEPTTFTVTYDANGGTPNTVPTDANEYESGAQVTVKGNVGNITKSGKIWSGWNTAANGTGTSYKEGDKFNIASNTTLYARWIDDYSNEDYADITGGYLNLPTSSGSGYTSQTLVHADDGMEYVVSPSSSSYKVYAITAANGTNDFDSSSLSKVFLGQNGAYLYNKDPLPRSIDKVEVYASTGCSTKVSVAVDLGTTVRSSSYSTSPTTLSTQDHVYTLKQNQSAFNYTYFRLQVTNGYNANIQIRITFSIPTTSVTVTPESVTLNPGDNQQLSTTVLPANNTDSLSYASSDTGVATVSNSGLIHAVAAGTAVITATSGSCSDTCEVTVELPLDPFITPNKESTSGYSGAHEDISFLYGNLGLNSLTVVSSDENVVTANAPSYSDGSGTVRINFVGAGSTTVKFKGGASELASLSVSVTASSVSITGLASSSAAYVGKTLDLGSTITITAVGIYSDEVTWSSDNDAVAEVDSNGIVTGVASGVANITVTSDDYPSATMTCEVTVSVDTRWDTEFPITMVGDIQLPASGDTQEKYYVVAQITAITNTTYGNGNAVDEDGTAFAIYGMYNFNGNIRYDSMPSEQKPVAGDFVVLYGVFTKYNNAPEIKNAWLVQRNGNVFETPALAGITLNKEALLLGQGSTFTLVASPNPVDAEMASVTWESSNDEIVSVNSSGVVTGEAVGSATITATAGGFTATCNVTVSLMDTMIYDGGSTTNMAATGNAVTVNLDSNLFTVDAAKGGNNNFPGLNTNGEIRAYNGNDIIVTIDSNYTITNVVFDYQAGKSYSQVFADGVIVSENDDTYAINSDSFRIHANGDTIKINSVEIFYREANAAEKVSRLDTQASLAFSDYNDEGDGTFTFTNLKIRFKGLISESLWEDLDNVTGYGILLATTDVIGNDSVKDYYDLSENYTSNPDFKHDAINFTNTKATPTLSGGYYGWSLHQSIAAEDITTTFVVAAYIVLGGNNVVFLNETRVSVQSIAAGLIQSGAVAEDDLGGSMKYLADQTNN